MKKVLALQKLQQLLDETVDNRAGSRSATENKTTTPGITEAKAEIHKKQKFQITLTPAIPKPKEPDGPEENQNLNKNMIENWHLIGARNIYQFKPLFQLLIGISAMLSHRIRAIL